VILFGRNYRIGILTLLLEDEFESSRITLQPILGQLNYDARLFVLLNGPPSCAIRDFFDRHRHVHFFCAARNLGVAGGRNFLCRHALLWGADILVCYDNDFLPPRAYVTLICRALIELARRERVGIIAPALLNGNACTDYWKVGYDRSAQARETTRCCEDNLSFDPDDVRQFLRTYFYDAGYSLFYHLGIRVWRAHYINWLSPRWESLRHRLHSLIPIIPPPTDYGITMLVRNSEVQQAVLGGSGPVSVDTLPGGAHCFFASLIRELQGYDENFNPFGFEDSDLCIRALCAGYCNYLIPAIPLIHDVTQRHMNRTPLALLHILGRARRIFRTKYCNGRLSFWLGFASEVLLNPVRIFRQEFRRLSAGCGWSIVAKSILGGAIYHRIAAKALQAATIYVRAFLGHRVDRSKAVHTFPAGARKILYIPHNAYHALNMSYAVSYLHQAGIETLFVNVEEAYRDKGARREIERLGLRYVEYSPDVLDREQPDLVVVMNDWGGVVHQTVMQANRIGIPTVAIVEGVQDFEDTHVGHIGVGRIRRPYRTAKYVLATGDYDRKFLLPETSVVVGMPRVEPLLAESPAFPEHPLVAINCNFTYGLYTEQRREWIDSAVSACAQAGMDYVITQHHADDMDLTGYRVIREPLHDVLRKCTVVASRFSTVLLEAMALGIPTVYHNPHGERMDTFREPLGAYRVTRNSVELAAALREAVTWAPNYRERCRAFFRYHVSVENRPAGERTATAIIEILKKEPRPAQQAVGYFPPVIDRGGAVSGSTTRHLMRKVSQRVRNASG
jgi:GT2 family glycosyltransferase